MQRVQSQRVDYARALAHGTALLFLLAGAPLALAATGSIDSAHKYAWSNVGGYVNFAPSSSTVTVTDAALTGYAWAANDGWINLAPANGGVHNDGQGNLSGFAWDSSAGWFSFTGVTIDAFGRFHGVATGAGGNAISFDCSSCDVETDWRHPSASFSSQSRTLSSTSPNAAPQSPLVTLPSAVGPNGNAPGATSTGPFFAHVRTSSSTAHAATSVTATSTPAKKASPVSDWWHPFAIVAGAVLVVLIVIVVRFFL